jgi:cell wall-associated NlpC family hydrolase
MKSTLIILVCLGTGLAGCVGYPRYGRSQANVPRDVVPVMKGRTTEDFLRFGEIVSRYLGKPYQGNSRYQQGMDCSLFTQTVLREYAKVDPGRSTEEQFRQGREVPRTRLMPGDLVFFTTERDRVSHVGIYVGFNEFVHASSSQGVIISGLNESYWAQRYVAARRVIE